MHEHLKEALNDCEGRGLDWFVYLVIGPGTVRLPTESDEDFRQRVLVQQQQQS
jgi:hypothetical protein